jgi:hypothetical protein
MERGNMTNEVTNAERMTLGRLHAYDSFPCYTRWVVFKTLVEKGLVDVRVTAKGLMALDAFHGKEHKRKLPYAAQVRSSQFRNGDPEHGWVTLFRGCTEYDAATMLWEPMQEQGFRLGELADHAADLAKGHVLTTEEGAAFRVVHLPGEIEHQD